MVAGAPCGRITDHGSRAAAVCKLAVMNQAVHLPTVRSQRPHRSPSTFPPSSSPINLHPVTPRMGQNAGIRFPSKSAVDGFSSPF